MHNATLVHTGTVRGFIHGVDVQFVQNGDKLTVKVGRKVVYTGTNEVSRARILNNDVLPLCNMHKSTRMSYPLWAENSTQKSVNW